MSLLYIVTDEDNLEKKQDSVDISSGRRALSGAENANSLNGIELPKEQSEIMEAYYSPDKSGFWIFMGISLGLTLFAGLMSGLTVGYLSIDELVLEMKLKNGTAQEMRDVEGIYIIYIGKQNNAYIKQTPLAALFSINSQCSCYGSFTYISW